MKCESKFMDITYGSQAFCKACGMDIGLNPIKSKHKGIVELYCCEDCAKLR
jgi:hypothetical protein